MDLRLQQAMPRMVERLDVARDSLDGRLTEFQSTFWQDLGTLAKGIQDFANHIDDARERDREALGQTLSNIAAGISMMSTAVMETRMVFPAAEGDFTTAIKTPSAIPATSTLSPPSAATPSLLTAHGPPTNPATPRPSAPTNTKHSSPAARVLAALKRTGQQGRLLFEGEPKANERADTAAQQKGGMERERGEGSGGDGSVLERDHRTVDALWREYDEGVFGPSSVGSMLERKLRKSESQRKRWERRRIVINEIKRLKKERTTSAQAIVDAMHRFMKKERLPMAKLQDGSQRPPGRARSCRCGSSSWLLSCRGA